MILVYITIAFALLAAGFLIAGKLPGNAGWDSLDYLVYAMATAALWGVAVVGYLIWLVIRDGWQASSIPAAVLLAALVVAAATWGYRRYAEEADCRAAEAFYISLAAMPAGDRPAAIGSAGAYVTSPSDCAIDGLSYAFGRSLLAPDAGSTLPDDERYETLSQLLDAGLPPGDRLLFDMAVNGADAPAVRLLLRRRKSLNEAGTDGAPWDLFPDLVVQPLITRARVLPDAPVDAHATAYRTTLSVFVADGQPNPSALSASTRRALTELGLLPAR